MNRFRWLAAVLALALALGTVSTVAGAAETITSFSSTVMALADGSADVTEVIEFVTEGKEIEHGIVRNLVLLVPSGLEIAPSGVTVESVVLDGAPEPYSQADLREGVQQIRIGRADVFLQGGPHRYELRYRVLKALTRFVDMRGLYWNMGIWSEPIEKATVRFVLPDSAKISQVEATEADQAIGSEQVERPSDHEVTVHLERTLAPRERFSVNVLAKLPLEGPAVSARHLLEVVAGPAQSCVLAEGGELYCWDVLTADGTIIREPMLMDLPPLTDVDLGDNGQGCGLDRSGQVLCWAASNSSSTKGLVPSGVRTLRANARFVKLSVGFAHICALDDAGAVWCGGSNAEGELGTGDTTSHPDELLRVLGLGKAVDVSAGVSNSCAVLLVGEVWCWGTDSPVTSAKLLFDSLTPIRIDKLVGIFAVHNGRNFMCGLESNAVDCWGSNIDGQLGVTPDLMGGRIAGLVKIPSGPPTSIGAGLFNACGTFDEGLVLCWGSWNGKTICTARPVEGLSLAKAVSVNADKACVLTANEEVWCWGDRPKRFNHQVLETTYAVAPWQVVIPTD